MRQIALDEKSFAPSIDVLNGKILCGVDNGKIITVNVDGSNKEIHSTTHCNGEAWGLHVIQEKGTFLTCADDNNFFEYSISEKKLLRSGKIWMSNFYGGHHNLEKVFLLLKVFQQLLNHQLQHCL